MGDYEELYKQTANNLFWITRAKKDARNHIKPWFSDDALTELEMKDSPHRALYALTYKEECILIKLEGTKHGIQNRNLFKNTIPG